MICIKILLFRWMQCWPPYGNFPSSLREVYKIYTFFEESIFYFSSKWSSGLEECTDYNLAEEFMTKAEKCSLNVQKR